MHVPEYFWKMLYENIKQISDHNDYLQMDELHYLLLISLLK